MLDKPFNQPIMFCSEHGSTDMSIVFTLVIIHTYNNAV